MTNRFSRSVPKIPPPKTGQKRASPGFPNGVGNDAAVALGLNAAIVAMRYDQPQILVIGAASGPHASCAQHSDGELHSGLEAQSGKEDRTSSWDTLPYGAFSPLDHRTLEIGLRSWVKTQTGLELGYVNQLYTFGDQGRHARTGDIGPHIVSIGYLALTGADDDKTRMDARWRPWYRFFPWEDWRRGKPEILSTEIEPRLRQWAANRLSKSDPQRALNRADRLRISFGLDGAEFDEEKTLERYELLYEAGLVAEAARDERASAFEWTALPAFGDPMQFDHRRVLATAMGRLRGQLKYRPVIFELMAESFTLLQLQKTVEAISGTLLHKQNFRRLVEQTGLVEPTGGRSTASGGRPAQLYHFRKEALLERPAPGLRVKAHRK